MIWLSKENEELLRKITEKVSADELQKQWEKVIEFAPMPSGTPQEEAAIQYMKNTLEDYGLTPEILRYYAYISIPLEAQLTVVSPRTIELQCNPYRCVASTPAGGVEGDLIYIERDDLGSMECKDKIVLTQTLGTQSILTLQEMGAKGVVAIDRDSFMPTVIHQSADFSVSGNPTPDNYHLIPQLPMVKVSNADGERLKSMCRQGPVRVHMKVVMDTGWKLLPLLVAEIKGVKDPDKFVLVNGHVDTPPFSPGVTDNVSGDVALMELARIFNKYKDKLGRSLRFAWWTGHEIGRYAGSTWYNDAFWHDLRYNCVAFLNVDSPGAEGATEFDERSIDPASETRELAAKSVLGVTGQKVERFAWSGRSADRSFWGTGFPHTFICSVRPEGERDPFVGFSGLGWWWHTPWATLDRGDVDILAMNVKVYAHFLFPLCNSPILPMSPVHLAEDSLEALKELQTKAEKIRAYFNLYPVLDRTKEFKAQAEALEKLVEGVISEYERAENKEAFEPIFEEINQCMMWVSRHINLVLHTDSEPTKQMTMWSGARPFAVLRPILDLAKLPLPYPGASPDFLILKTKLLRERNKVEDSFFLATQEIKETIEKVRAQLT